MSAGPAAICRQDEAFLAGLADPAGRASAVRSAVATALAGSALYGLSFGCWRSPEQALVAAVKMPVLIFAVIATAGLLSVFLAAALAPGLTRGQIGYGLLAGFAVASAVLGALAPALAFLALQAPPPGSPHDGLAYRVLLLSHTACVGAAGLAGFLRLHALLVRFTGNPARARRVLAAWIGAAGLAGCEWSWVLSPFLARPGGRVPWINPDAFSCNFFEYVWRALAGAL